MSVEGVTDRQGENGGEDGEWLRAAYHEGQADIRWAKERASVVTYWAVVLVFGLAGVHRLTGAVLDEVWIVLAILAVAGFSLGWLAQLHCFAADTRQRVVKFLKGAFPPGHDYPTEARNHVGHLLTYGAVVVFSAILATAVLLTAPDHP